MVETVPILEAQGQTVSSKAAFSPQPTNAAGLNRRGEGSKEPPSYQTKHDKAHCSLLAKRKEGDKSFSHGCQKEMSL